MRKLDGVCVFCSHAATNVHGDYCSKAEYREHGGGYGNSWVRNECLHDQNQPKLKSLFAPNSEESKIPLTQEIIDLRSKVLSLESENQKLRSLLR